jgi:hypothetical protein
MGNRLNRVCTLGSQHPDLARSLGTLAVVSNDLRQFDRGTALPPALAIWDIVGTNQVEAQPASTIPLSSKSLGSSCPNYPVGFPFHSLGRSDYRHQGVSEARDRLDPT